jgi:RNA recognition motif-containing protein
MDICVGNLPRDMTRSDLREVFELFGRVETADMVKHRPGEESRGLGFVGMPARSEAIRAVLGVHGRNVNGRAITATEVRPRDPVSGACRTRCPCQSGK